MTLPGLGGRALIPVEDEVKKLWVEKLAYTLITCTGRRCLCLGCMRDAWILPSLERCRTCCDHQWTVRGYMRKGDGHYCAQTLCVACGIRDNIPANDKAPVEDLLFRDNIALGVTETCARCGKVGAQLHHWAPWAIFNDAALWPTSPLCPECHSLWHATMRAANGYRLPPEQRVGENSWASPLGGVA